VPDLNLSCSGLTRNKIFAFWKKTIHRTWEGWRHGASFFKNRVAVGWYDILEREKKKTPNSENNCFDCPTTEINLIWMQNKFGFVRVSTIQEEIT